MTNLEKYNRAFCETFGVAEKDLPALKFGEIAAWDSAGHMILISALEDAFEIVMETADVLSFRTYAAGLEILQKNYGVGF